MKATVAGEELSEYFDEITDLIGTIPHAKLDHRQKPNIQKGRQLKVFCPACDFKYNTSKTQIERITNFCCPVCQVANMQQA